MFEQQLGAVETTPGCAVGWASTHSAGLVRHGRAKGQSPVYTVADALAVKEIGAEPGEDDEHCADAAETEAPLMKVDLVEVALVEADLVEADLADADSAGDDPGEAWPVAEHCYGNCLDHAPASAPGQPGSESLRCHGVRAAQSEALRQGLLLRHGFQDSGCSVSVRLRLRWQVTAGCASSVLETLLEVLYSLRSSILKGHQVWVGGRFDATRRAQYWGRLGG